VKAEPCTAVAQIQSGQLGDAPQTVVEGRAVDVQSAGSRRPVTGVVEIDSQSFGQISTTIDGEKPPDFFRQCFIIYILVGYLQQ
jgi:hypothetical protein